MQSSPRDVPSEAPRAALRAARDPSRYPPRRAGCAMTSGIVNRARGAQLVAFAGAMDGVSRVLASQGWEVRALELDAVHGRMDIKLHRTDGRWVHARIEDGRCTVERWHREVVFGVHPSLKKGPHGDYVSDRFLGRFKAASPVAAFRFLADYITENSPKAGALSGRDMLRPALEAWHKADEAASRDGS